MKKTLTTVAMMFAIGGVAYAQEVRSGVAQMKRPEGMATSTRPAPAPMMPKPTTGSSTLDAQVDALHVEMEKKIQAIRDEYEAKIKALVGDRKPMASSSMEVRRDVKEDIKNLKKDLKNVKVPEVRGVSSSTLPVGNAWGFFRRFLGLNDEQ